ncbi:MAG: cytochrome c-type biogenesis protein [Methyloligellaceae bacterium]
MQRLAFLLALVLPLLAGEGPALAVEPDEVLSDPKLESRARKISLELRCLVCQNQSIDDSNAPLARDLRVLVRERLKAGDTDVAVIDFVVARYGEFVLLRPRFALHTLILWLGAPLLLLLAVIIMVRAYRRRMAQEKGAPTTGLSAEEKRKVEALLDQE